MRLLHAFVCIAILVVVRSAPVLAAEPTVFTLWPLLDLRLSADDDYASANLFGPLVKFERGRGTLRYGLRPLFFHQEGRDRSWATDELLYPVATHESSGAHGSYQFLHWLTLDTREDGANGQGIDSFMLFPFLFYGTEESGRDMLAFFPLGGHLEGMYGRERIDFALFPLYSHTRRGDTEVTNLLWPVFARVSGRGESGWKFWPLAGRSAREGTYRKSFYLWPVWTDNHVALDTPDPVRQISVFPFWTSEQSTASTSESILWPLFNHTDDARKGYEEWDFPWPLVRVTHGESRHGWRVLPFASDETLGASRKRWWLWPLYKIEERDTGDWHYRRDRIAYFLYSDESERSQATESRRIALWPLFSYVAEEGVSNFATLALLEPFFPANERIDRNWAPLWRIYQSRWDTSGNAASSFLWNLYWKERRRDALAWELFPLVSYRHRPGILFDLSVVKGLVRYRTDAEGSKLMLLFLPWGIPIGPDMPATGTGGR